MHTILFVDNDKDYREVTRELLELNGYTVVLADNGKTALSLLQQSQPDLILSDNRMPVMTGIELLQTVKSDHQLQAIPYILVAGEAIESLLSETSKLAVDAILVKPVMIGEILALLQQLLP